MSNLSEILVDEPKEEEIKINENNPLHNYLNNINTKPQNESENIPNHENKKPLIENDPNSNNKQSSSTKKISIKLISPKDLNINNNNNNSDEDLNNPQNNSTKEKKNIEIKLPEKKEKIVEEINTNINQIDKKEEQNLIDKVPDNEDDEKEEKEEKIIKMEYKGQKSEEIIFSSISEYKIEPLIKKYTTNIFFLLVIPDKFKNLIQLTTYNKITRYIEDSYYILYSFHFINEIKTKKLGDDLSQILVQGPVRKSTEKLSIIMEIDGPGDHYRAEIRKKEEIIF